MSIAKDYIGSERETALLVAPDLAQSLQPLVDTVHAYNDWAVIRSGTREWLTGAIVAEGVCQSDGVSRVVGVTDVLRRVGRRR
ncbi:hypothetical protein [Streptomyces sp. NRRL S-378]|uniref:hypothetical protein n=1 Tax=Streptomyces sp. NRRL S-378 TaxID=1463904 RepID=UPI0004C4EF0C|nr:hypothetical protein [Streptomyces sp. NRRL S-378]